jgi:hypothetical protein
MSTALKIGQKIVQFLPRLSFERNVDSSSNGYGVVRKECNVTVISTTATVPIGAGAVGDTHLIGLMFTNALAGTCVVAGFADSAGAAQSITFPAGTVGFRDFYGAINSGAALTVTCSTAGDDNFCCVLWRPI